MFESAELGHKIDKALWDKAMPKLRTDLLDAQFELGELGKFSEANKFPVIILINGLDAAGKGETVKLLNNWMDPRHIQNVAFPPPSDEERERPFMWRFWRALPPKGSIGILFGNWYTDPVQERVAKRSKRAELDSRLNEINRFEEMLAQEGALVLKFWFHITEAMQKTRLKALENDPDTRWRVTKTDWAAYKQYDEYRRVSEHVLRQTSTSNAPWIVVDGADEHYRSLMVGNTLLGAIRQRLAIEKRAEQDIEKEKGGANEDVANPAAAMSKAKAKIAAEKVVEKVAKKAAENSWDSRSHAAPLPAALGDRDLINTLNMKLKLSKKLFESELEKYQGNLALLTRRAAFKNRSLIIVFEGNDAAGKGGSIRRVTGAFDPRHIEVHPIAAPSEEERAQPYLWRFWRRIPRTGRVAIFDRSWYGRVLVERVEGFCAENDWMRAYTEINDFEDQLIADGAVVVKFWLAITPEEQLKRFKSREKTNFKRFKITPDDWRNRDKWNAYERAVCDMIDRTSTENAPWTLVEANDKYYARIKVLKTICETLDRALKD